MDGLRIEFPSAKNDVPREMRIKKAFKMGWQRSNKEITEAGNVVQLLDAQTETCHRIQNTIVRKRVEWSENLPKFSPNSQSFEPKRQKMAHIMEIAWKIKSSECSKTVDNMRMQLNNTIHTINRIPTSTRTGCFLKLPSIQVIKHNDTINGQ